MSPARRRQLAVFEPTGSDGPRLACSLRQVVEVRSRVDILAVRDPSGVVVGYVKRRGEPIPVLDLVRDPALGRGGPGRLLLLRGAGIAKIVAVPLDKFWIEDLDDEGPPVIALETSRKVAGVDCLARLDTRFGEALLLDVDGIVRSVVV